MASHDSSKIDYFFRPLQYIIGSGKKKTSRQVFANSISGPAPLVCPASELHALLANQNLTCINHVTWTKSETSKGLKFTMLHEYNYIHIVCSKKQISQGMQKVCAN